MCNVYQVNKVSQPHSILRLEYNHRKMIFLYGSVAEPEPVESKICGDLEPEPEPEPKINLNKHLLQSVGKMLRQRKPNFYL